MLPLTPASVKHAIRAICEVQLGGPSVKSALCGNRVGGRPSQAWSSRRSRASQLRRYARRRCSSRARLRRRMASAAMRNGGSQSGMTLHSRGGGRDGRGYDAAMLGARTPPRSLGDRARAAGKSAGLGALSAGEALVEAVGGTVDRAINRMQLGEERVTSAAQSKTLL